MDLLPASLQQYMELNYGSGYFYCTVNATHLAILTATPEIN